MLVCDKGDNDRYAKTAPCLLVEVLSQGTASHDCFGKYGVYTAIPSLQTYLIVEGQERRVYAYQRGPGGWVLQDLGCTLTLDEIYLGVL